MKACLDGAHDILRCYRQPRFRLFWARGTAEVRRVLAITGPLSNEWHSETNIWRKRTRRSFDHNLYGRIDG
jgi:hypothetical protein